MRKSQLSKSQTIILLTDGEFSDKENWNKLKECVQSSKVKIHTIAIKAKYFIFHYIIEKSSEHERELKMLANWGFGNCISLNDVSHLQIVVSELLKVGIETPKVEVSLEWKGVRTSALNM